jgi:HTH-type transcriptional regulator/antitoxin HigA
MNAVIEPKVASAWKQVAPVLAVDSPASYRHASQLLDRLTDEVGDDEKHPLARLMDTLGTLVSSWESTHYPIPEASPRQVLAYLMNENRVKQTELKEIGSQGIVSEILSGKRELNVRQIRALAKRFHVSPAVFF